MKLTIEDTPEIVEWNGQPGRIWVGQTAEGVPVKCCLVWVSPQTHDEQVNDQFARELIEIKGQPA